MPRCSSSGFLGPGMFCITFILGLHVSKQLESVNDPAQALRSARPLSPSLNKGNIPGSGSHRQTGLTAWGSSSVGDELFFNLASDQVPENVKPLITYDSFWPRSKNYTNIQEQLFIFSHILSFPQIYCLNLDCPTPSPTGVTLPTCKRFAQSKAAKGPILRSCKTTSEVLVCLRKSLVSVSG